MSLLGRIYSSTIDGVSHLASAEHESSQLGLDFPHVQNLWLIYSSTTDCVSYLLSGACEPSRFGLDFLMCNWMRIVNHSIAESSDPSSSYSSTTDGVSHLASEEHEPSRFGLDFPLFVIGCGLLIISCRIFADLSTAVQQTVASYLSSKEHMSLPIGFRFPHVIDVAC
ncbi:hypothetical protein AVEN_213229-1 [Araneus ventricosus]|uniref:Uncharacterized protein n=1 Tax=Araneus ventricosus TaxID=182803 RepID=A0A4Y2JQT1_ARAVE|nr:hypothetical protein AVEN_213229-1 [Araneus ventricosus]